MSEVKNISIRGDAVSAYTKVKTRKRKQNGGYDVPSSGQIQLNQKNMARVTNFVSKMSGAPTMVGGSAPIVYAAPAPAPAAPAPAPAAPILSSLPSLPASPVGIKSDIPTQSGGKAKLILEPKKRSMKKLHLAPASVSGTHTHNTHKRSVSKTRKIRVNLSGMKKRLTRARAIHKESRNNDIADIKKKLIEAKLIKASALDKSDSTEYDMMLRKTYEDYMLLRNRAL